MYTLDSLSRLFSAAIYFAIRYEGVGQATQLLRTRKVENTLRHNVVFTRETKRSIFNGGFPKATRCGSVV